MYEPRLIEEQRLRKKNDEQAVQFALGLEGAFAEMDLEGFDEIGRAHV